MADLIDRAALLADIDETVFFSATAYTYGHQMRAVNKVKNRIKAAPAVDAVEVIRCKNCNWGSWWQNWLGIEGFKCGLFCADVNPEGFCSYGERKET